MSKEENWLNEIEKDYNSLESYLKERMEGGAEPLLFGYEPFLYLWKKGLLKEDDFIRTNLQGGFTDGHYKLTNKGELEGVEAAKGLYSGDPGIHHPKKILNIKNSDHGWTLSSFAQARIRLSNNK